MFYALLALSGGFLIVFGMGLYALARIGKMLNATDNLDWEQIATMTGDIGALKKSIQRLNNRINGMEAKDPTLLLQQLAAAQQPHIVDNNIRELRKGG